MHPERPSDPEVLQVDTPAGTVTYTDEGQGPCVVALHGMPGSVRDFRWMAPELSQNCRLVRLDMPDFGASEVSVGPRVPELAEYVDQALDALGIEQAVVMGHSFGTPVALRLAATKPERYLGLILLAPVGLRRHIGLRRAGVFLPLAGWLDHPYLRHVMWPFARRAFQISGFSKRTPDREIRRTLNVLKSFDFDLQDWAVERLEVPSFVAYCEDDPLIEAQIMGELGQMLTPGPRLQFDSGKHNPQKAWATELSEAVSPWAQSLPWQA